MPGPFTMSLSWVRDYRVNIIYELAFRPDGQILAAGTGHPHLVLLCEVATGQELAPLSGHTDHVLSVAFSPAESLLASGSADTTIKLWDLATGKPQRTLNGHTDSVYSVAFHPDGQLLASGSWDNTIRLWDVMSGQEHLRLMGHSERVETVAWSPTGQQLVSSDRAGIIKLWDMPTGRCVWTLPGGGNPVAFSPDGAVLASVPIGDVKLWEVATGTEQGRLPSQERTITTISFHPEGQVLAVGAAAWHTAPIHLWDLTTQTVFQLLKGAEQVDALVFSPNGTFLACNSFGLGIGITLWQRDY